MIPNPGSKEAIKNGCTCAVLDNARGAEWMKKARGFYITQGCPLHDRPEDKIHWDD